MRIEPGPQDGCSYISLRIPRTLRAYCMSSSVIPAIDRGSAFSTSRLCMEDTPGRPGGRTLPSYLVIASAYSFLDSLIRETRKSCGDSITTIGGGQYDSTVL